MSFLTRKSDVADQVPPPSLKALMPLPNVNVVFVEDQFVTLLTEWKQEEVFP